MVKFICVLFSLQLASAVLAENTGSFDEFQRKMDAKKGTVKYDFDAIDDKAREIRKMAKAYGSSAPQMEKLGDANIDRPIEDIQKIMDAYKGSAAESSGYVGNGIPLNWSLRFLAIEYSSSTSYSVWTFILFFAFPMFAFFLLKNAPNEGITRVVAICCGIFLIRNIDYTLMFALMFVVGIILIYVCGALFIAKAIKG